MLHFPHSLLHRHFSVRKPEIVIDEVPSRERVSISIGGITTYRQSSDDGDGIRRSSSEVMGGVVFPNTNNESRRGSGMSNSSASLQLHDMHQLLEQNIMHDSEIFV